MTQCLTTTARHPSCIWMATARLNRLTGGFGLPSKVPGNLPPRRPRGRRRNNCFFYRYLAQAERTFFLGQPSFAAGEILREIDPRNPLRDRLEEAARDCCLRHLEDHVPGLKHNLDPAIGADALLRLCQLINAPADPPESLIR